MSRVTHTVPHAAAAAAAATHATSPSFRWRRKSQTAVPSSAASAIQLVHSGMSSGWTWTQLLMPRSSCGAYPVSATQEGET